MAVATVHLTPLARLLSLPRLTTFAEAVAIFLERTRDWRAQVAESAVDTGLDTGPGAINVHERVRVFRRPERNPGRNSLVVARVNVPDRTKVPAMVPQPFD